MAVENYASKFVVPLKKIELTPQPVVPVVVAEAAVASAPTLRQPVINTSRVRQALSGLLANRVLIAALLVLIIGTAIIRIGGSYISTSQDSKIASLSRGAAVSNYANVAGLNLSVPDAQLPAKLQSITSQPMTLTVGTQNVPITPSIIKSWLEITPGANSSSDIHVNSATIATSLLKVADGYVTSPVNQVSVTHTDGITPSGVIVAGSNGSKLNEPSSLGQQAAAMAKNLMNGNGNFAFSTPLQTVPYQALTPANFNKLIEVDLTSKRLYAYQNGQVVNTFLISAGKPSTPTPVGEFHIWDKLTSQTMTGPGYVQPNVPWVNYFDHSGDAIHGVYWRPASVFGNVNTSHGCVGLQVNNAEWIFNWAPIGTTVITYDT